MTRREILSSLNIFLIIIEIICIQLCVLYINYLNLSKTVRFLLNGSVCRIKISYIFTLIQAIHQRIELLGERIFGSVTVGYKWRNRVSITAVRRLRFPINIHVLMSNVEIKDRLSLRPKTLRIIRATEIKTRIIIYNSSFSQSCISDPLNFKETSREINSRHFNPCRPDLFKNFVLQNLTFCTINHTAKKWSRRNIDKIILIEKKKEKKGGKMEKKMKTWKEYNKRPWEKQ